MFSKFELMIGGFCVAMMAFALFLVQAENNFDLMGEASQTAQAIDSAGIIFVTDEADEKEARTEAFTSAINNGKFERMVIDDIKVGVGAEVKAGDVVSVHYVGTLQNGQEFDSSRRRGEPFEFTVGAGQVIKGWDEGVVGMKVGGQRILVIPSDMAYGDKGIGPIPGGATLVFSIELLEVK